MCSEQPKAKRKGKELRHTDKIGAIQRITGDSTFAGDRFDEPTVGAGVAKHLKLVVAYSRGATYCLAKEQQATCS